MAEEGEDDGDFPIVEFNVVSEDEVTANIGNETDADREAWRARNRACTIRRRSVNERRRSMHHELDPEFAAVSEQGFRTPVANIARVTAILERSNNPNGRQALLTRRGPRSSWISKTQRVPSGRSAWARAGSRLTAERLAVILDLNPATTSTTLTRARPLAGGSSHLQGVTRDRPIISLLHETCVSTLMKIVMHGSEATRFAKKSRPKVLITATVSQLSLHGSEATSTLRASS
jgi:hypothetical protein